MGSCCSSTDDPNSNNNQQLTEEDRLRRKRLRALTRQDSLRRSKRDFSDEEEDDDDEKDFTIESGKGKFQKKRRGAGKKQNLNPLSADATESNEQEEAEKVQLTIDPTEDNDENNNNVLPSTPSESDNEDEFTLDDDGNEEPHQSASKVVTIINENKPNNVNLKSIPQTHSSPELATEHAGSNPSGMVTGDEKTLHLRTSTKTKTTESSSSQQQESYEAVAIGNQIYVSDISSSSSSSSQLNRAIIRPLGYLGKEEEEQMKSRSCSALAFSHDSSMLATATREGRISLWLTATGEPAGAFGWSASIRNIRAGARTNPSSSVNSRTSSISTAQPGNSFGQFGGFFRGGGDVGGNPEEFASTSNVFQGVELSADLSPNSRRRSTAMISSTSASDMKLAMSLSSGSGATTSTNAAIHSIAWSRNDQNVFCGLADGNIAIWDVNIGAPREDVPMICNAHSSWVVSLAVSENGKYLASSSIDETICIFDVSALMTIGVQHHQNRSSSMVTKDQNQIKLLHRIENGHSGCVNCVVFAKDLKVESTNSTLSSPTETKTESTTTTAKNIKKKFKNYCHVISASSDKSIKCWDVRTGQQRGDTISPETVAGAHSDSITSLAISKPDGKHLISVSQDRTLCVYDVEEIFFKSLVSNGNQKQQQMKSEYNQSVFGIQVEVTQSTTDVIAGTNNNNNNNNNKNSGKDSPQNTSGMLVGKSGMSNLASLGLLSGSHQQHFRADRLRTGHRDNVTGVCCIPNSKVALTCSLDEMMKVWNVDHDTNHSANFHLGTDSSSPSTTSPSASQQNAFLLAKSSFNINNSNINNASTSSALSAVQVESTQVHQSPSTLVAHSNPSSFSTPPRVASTSSLNNGGTSPPSRNPSTVAAHQSQSQHLQLHGHNNNQKSPKASFSAASGNSLLSSITSQRNLKTLLADVQVKSRLYAVAATNDGFVVACGRMDGRTSLFAVCRGSPISRRPLELEQKVVSMGFTDDGKELVATDLQGDMTRFLLSTIKM